jgi:hypothetical protein
MPVFSVVGHRTLALAGAAAVVLASVAVVTPASAAQLTVCKSGCPYTEVGPALAAAHDGDTIRVGAGVYAGGLHITKSVTVIGAGRDLTVIRGGGPVITIGTAWAATEPTVALRALTVTGGVSRTGPWSDFFFGASGVIATGGGIEVPLAANFEDGATVTLTDTAVVGNRVAPTTTLPGGPECSPGVQCPFAAALGGGIFSGGNLTLVRTSLSNNLGGTAAGLTTPTSDVEGGGLFSIQGDVVVRDSVMEGNRISASAPNGNYVDSGGAYLGGRSVVMSHSVVRGNSAILTAAAPTISDPVSHAGGMHVGENVSPATISDTVISYNTVVATNTVGHMYADSGGMQGNTLLGLYGDNFDHNSVYSATLPGSTGPALGDSGAGEVSGTITRTRVTNNTMTSVSFAGDASSGAGGVLFSGTMTESVVSGNKVVVDAAHGRADITGVGIQAGDFELTVANTSVTGNVGAAAGLRGGSAHGAGIWDAPVFQGPPGGPMTLTGDTITGNKLIGGPRVTITGAGVYTTYPLTRSTTTVAGNFPDQCVDCGTTAAAKEMQRPGGTARWTPRHTGTAADLVTRHR